MSVSVRIRMGPLVAALLAACGGEAPRTAASEATCDIGTRLVAELGDLEDPVSIADPYSPPVVTRLAGGGWVVLDGVLRRVLRYGPNGRYRGFVGGAGEGPEELVYPASAMRGKSDSLWIADRRQPRWVVFDPEGAPVRTVSLDAPQVSGGLTPSGLSWSLHRATIHGPSPDGIHYGDVERMGLVLRRFAPDGRPLEPIGPGVPVLRDGGRVGIGWGAVHAVSDTVFLVGGSWDGDDASREASAPIPAPPTESVPGVWRWTPGSNRVWTPPGALAGELERLDLPPTAMITALGSDGAGGFWLLAASPTPHPEIPTAPGGGGAGRLKLSSTSGLGTRNVVTDGVAWHLDGEGGVTGAVRFDEFPDGLTGPNEFHSLWEDPSTGFMAVRIYALERRCG